MNIQVVRDFRRLRHEMVETAIFGRGVRSEPVLNAMRKVRREAFLPKELREFAYEDAPLPIEAGQTISQPFIVAFMTEALGLEGGERVLEIGAGSGYAAAVLSEIAGEVFTISDTAMSMCFMVMGPRGGQSMRPMTGSLSPLAGRRSRSR